MTVYDVQHRHRPGSYIYWLL